LLGVALRAFVTTWGEGVDITQVLTLRNFTDLANFPNLVRGITNTLLIGVVGGAASVAIYTAIALAIHRWSNPLAVVADYLVLVPGSRLPGYHATVDTLWYFR